MELCKMFLKLSLIFVLIFSNVTSSFAVEDRYVKPAGPNERVACYISNGDNDILYHSPPIESFAAIDDLFDVLQKVYGLERLYWRAPQIEQLVNHSEYRKENFYYTEWIKWLDYLYNDVGTGKYAVEAAHKRGMSVWGVAAIFDHGAHPLVDVSKASGPWPIECRLRLENPEWVPVDKHGIRRQSGMISLAYPEARKALVDMFVEIALSADYDGLTFHTYEEEFYARFQTEFGYNAPIVADYMQRYGVDIRTQPFDKQKWAKLRGEYVTEFLRELKKAFDEIGVKLGMTLSSNDPGLPQPWLADQSLLPTGQIQMDWQRWVDEGLVDELFVYVGGDRDKVLDQVLEKVEGTEVEVATLNSGAYQNEQKQARYTEKGVIRTIDGGNQELEYGYYNTLPVESLNSDDFISRLSVIQQMNDGRTPLDIDKVVKALDDPHVLVRRRAVLTLGSIETLPEKALIELEKALDDPENTVRCCTLKVLSDKGASRSINRIFESLERKYTIMLGMAGIWSLPAVANRAPEQLINGLHHSDHRVRHVTLRAIASANPQMSLLPEIINSTNDESPDVRYAAAMALGTFYLPQSQQKLLEMVNDPHPTVNNRAAFELSKQLQSNTEWIGGAAYEAFNVLKAKYAGFNSNYRGEHSEWAWRCIGEGLQRLGPRGQNALEEFLLADDEVVADHSWRLLYAPQTGQEYVHVSPERADVEYRFHPKLRKAAGGNRHEPAMMPYIVQDFDGFDFRIKDGSAGDLRHHKGLWRHLGEDSGCGVLQMIESPGRQNRVLRVGGSENAQSGFVDVLRTDYRITEGKIDARISFCRNNEQSGMMFWFTDSGHWTSNLKILVDSDGMLSCFDKDDRKITTDCQIPSDKWVNVGLRADLDSGIYEITIDDSAAQKTVVKDVLLKPGQSYNVILFMPSDKNSYMLVDNVSVEVTNPAYKSE
jgi:hypothetical protein